MRIRAHRDGAHRAHRDIEFIPKAEEKKRSRTKARSREEKRKKGFTRRRGERGGRQKKNFLAVFAENAVKAEEKMFSRGGAEFMEKARHIGT